MGLDCYSNLILDVTLESHSIVFSFQGDLKKQGMYTHTRNLLVLILQVCNKISILDSVPEPVSYPDIPPAETITFPASSLLFFLRWNIHVTSR